MHEKDPSNPLSKRPPANENSFRPHRDTDITPKQTDRRGSSTHANVPYVLKILPTNPTASIGATMTMYTIGHSKDVTLQVQKEEMVWGRKEIYSPVSLLPQKAKEINFGQFLLLASSPQNIFRRLPYPSARFRIRTRCQPDLSFSSSTVW